MTPSLPAGAISSLRIVVYLSLSLSLLPTSLHAREWRKTQVPNSDQKCTLCHVNALGGGERNAFGLDVEKFAGANSSNAFWGLALASLDSDGDGFTNGEEMGDPTGSGISTPGFKFTAPADPAQNPIKNKMPTLKISSPTTGTTLPAGTLVTITADPLDTDGTVSKVEFLEGTKKLGEALSAPFSTSVALLPGTHFITARATDDRKGTGKTTASVTVKISPALALQVSSIQRTSDTDVAVQWTGGVGPFVVQTRPTVTAPGWINGPVLLAHDAKITMAPDAGFVRVTDIGSVDAIALSCYLSGELEQPSSVEAPGASGFGLFRIEGNNLVFDVRATGLTGPALAAHIHGPASADETAPPVFDLGNFAVSDLGTTAAASGTLPLTLEQKAMILNGRAYVNFHTAAHGGGEVRGQIVPVLMESVILGHEETPNAIATPGVGSAGLLLVGNRLSFNITYRNLSGSAIAAHVHGPAAAGESAGVFFDLGDYTVGDPGTSGAFAGTVTLTPSQLSAVASGKAYINVHTPSHPGGEVRGQILPHLTAIPLTTVISGDSERPNPVATTGSGLGILRMENDELRFDIAYKGLSGPAMAGHFHGPAKASASTNVMVELTPYNGGAWGVNGSISGMVKLVTNQITAAKTGLMYLNLHTPNNPAGEVRGQLVPSVMLLTMDASKEIPSIPVVGIGNGGGTVVLAHDNLSLCVDYRSLGTTATAAHIHGPASTSQSAGVLTDIEPLKGANGLGTSGNFGGTLKADAKLINTLVDGLTYINIHTLTNKSGEIRGQITR